MKTDNSLSFIALRSLVEQHCLSIDEHSTLDFYNIIQSAFGNHSQSQEHRYAAISLICSIFQIPSTLRLSIMKRNLKDINNNLSSFIIQDANIINQQFQSSEQLQELQNSIENFTNLLHHKFNNDSKSMEMTVTIGNYTLPSKETKIKSNYINTPTTTYNLHNLAQAILTSRPIVIQGNSGSGKSYMIYTISELLGYKNDIIELHINDQTDCKTLIGSYICSDVPGEFIWQAGILTQAVLTGKWIIIENINHVPLEFIATIAPLLARRRLYLPHRDQEILAHPNFRLICTRIIAIPSLVKSNSNSEDSKENESDEGLNNNASTTTTSTTTTTTTTSSNDLLLPPWYATTTTTTTAAAVDYNHLIYIPTLQHFSHLFHYVHIHELAIEEMKNILLLKYPTILPSIIDKLLEVYLYINNKENTTSTTTTSTKKDKNMKKLLKFNNHNKIFGLREIMKTCNRIHSNCQEFNFQSNYITNIQKRIIFNEIIDIFAASIRVRSIYIDIILILGEILEISENEIYTFFINNTDENNINTTTINTINTDTSTTTTNNTNNNDQIIIKNNNYIKIGRATIITTTNNNNNLNNNNDQTQQNFALTKYSYKLLERVAVCVSQNESILLVGETGTGKTTSIQELANILNKKLIVQNLSLSTDVSDLLGGYRPVSMKQLFLPMYEIFIRLFNITLSSSNNTEYLTIVSKFYSSSLWRKLLKAFLKAADQAIKKLNKKSNKINTTTIIDTTTTSTTTTSTTNTTTTTLTILEQWITFRNKIERYEVNLTKIEYGFAFQFIDGLLIDALRSGNWVLLDEINLASSETLQALSGILDTNTVLYLTDSRSGELVPIQRHEDFRIFAAMNPPTDVGKKELPSSLLGRFTEIYTEELIDPSDLYIVVEKYLNGMNISNIIDDIVQVYLGCRLASEDHLTDSTGQRPRYSLRSLTRSLKAAKSFLAIGKYCYYI